MRVVLWILLGVIVLVGGVLGWLALRSPAQRPASAERIEATPESLARGQYLTLHVVDCVGCHSDFHYDLRRAREGGHGGTGRIPVRQEAGRARRGAGAEHHAGSGVRPRPLDRRRGHPRGARGRRPQGRGAVSDDALRAVPRAERRGRTLGRGLPPHLQADQQGGGPSAAGLHGDPPDQVRSETARRPRSLRRMRRTTSPTASTSSRSRAAESATRRTTPRANPSSTRSSRAAGSWSDPGGAS
jgi:hypothetical protein